MTRIIDISQEFFISRYINGIKLMSRESIASFQESGLLDKQICSVADIMKKPFNIFFMTADFEIRELNEVSWCSAGFYSRADAIGSSISKVVPDELQVAKVHNNNKQVMMMRQLNVIEEGVSLPQERTLQAVSFKMPWYNKDNSIIGVFGCAVVIHQDSLVCIADHLAAISSMFLPSQVVVKNLLAGRDINGKYFSARETEVIRWVIRGKTMREIGLMLELSQRTVESYFNNIKMKVGVNTKSQLIERVIGDFLT